MTNHDIDELLRREIERQLPLFEQENADQQTLRAALHGLRGSISMAGYSEISLVLAQLGRRLLEGDRAARSEAHHLLRETASRIDRGLPALASAWPVPPPGLRPSRVPATLECEYLDAMRARLGEIDAALALEGSAQSALAQAFRSAHSMKSSASSVGDDSFAWYCHGLESLLKSALDTESAARDAMVQLARHRALIATWLDDPDRALDTLRELAKRPSNRPLSAPERPSTSRSSRPPSLASAGGSGVDENSPRTTTSAELFDRVERALVYVLANTDRLAAITTSGGELRVDTRSVDALEQALLQLVRNAVAHGIEPPDERRRAGKRSTGKITLSAQQHDDVLELSVEDDGRGIDVESLRELLAEQGLLSANAPVAFDELLPFLFVPGLSTRSQADLLGGRGMGLDIAREAVAGVGGTLRLATRPGRGVKAIIEVLAPGKKPRGKPVVAQAAERHVAAVRELAALAGLSVDPASELARDDAHLLVAEAEGQQLAGFASVRVAGDVIELLDLATHPAWRRRGVAQSLLGKLVELGGNNALREIYLEVRESNLGAIALYDKLGFERIHQRERYYKNPVEDALCMRLVL